VGISTGTRWPSRVFGEWLLRRAGDWNGDGHLDLFVGRRVVSRHYGLTPRSYLLENDGTGHSRRHAREGPGACGDRDGDLRCLVDYDHDGKLDLIVVGNGWRSRYSIKKMAVWWTGPPRPACGKRKAGGTASPSPT